MKIKIGLKICVEKYCRCREGKGIVMGVVSTNIKKNSDVLSYIIQLCEEQEIV